MIPARWLEGHQSYFTNLVERFDSFSHPRCHFEDPLTDPLIVKYGRSSGITLGGVDFAKFAESFGARGFRMSGPEEIESVMDQALAHEGVSVVDVRIDYSGARQLASQVAEGTLR